MIESELWYKLYNKTYPIMHKSGTHVACAIISARVQTLLNSPTSRLMLVAK